MSIEETAGVHHIAYRSLTGVNLFTGILNKNLAGVKKEDKNKKKSSLTQLKFQCKFKVVVKQGAEYKVEHCLATFINSADRDSFADVYSEMTVV